MGGNVGAFTGACEAVSAVRINCWRSPWKAKATPSMLWPAAQSHAHRAVAWVEALWWVWSAACGTVHG